MLNSSGDKGVAAKYFDKDISTNSSDQGLITTKFCDRSMSIDSSDSLLPIKSSYKVMSTSFRNEDIAPNSCDQGPRYAN